MEIQIIATGSSGNCFAVGDGETRLLLDAGIPLARIERGVKFSLSAFAGCRLTHEHQDHSKAAFDLLSKGLPLYCSRGTQRALGLPQSYYVRTAATCMAFDVGSFEVMPFEAQHDAAEPLCYLIYSKCTHEKLLFITDCAYVSYRFSCLTHLLIECNYMTQLLYRSTEPALADRIVRSHMSLETCLRFLAAQDLSTIQQIYLIHISNTRGDGALMQRAVARSTGKEVILP